MRALICRLIGHRWEIHHVIGFTMRGVYYCSRCGEVESR